MVVFQYPLRVNGLSNDSVLYSACGKAKFQYPLRANGLSNRASFAASTAPALSLSVPSTGQWVEQPTIFDLVDEMGRLSVPSTGQWAEQQHRIITHQAAHPAFQYPLRANGLSNQWRSAILTGLCVISVPSTGQ